MIMFEDWFEEELKCKYEECPYKACPWHKYCLEEQYRNDYTREYFTARSLPLNFEDIEECTLYLDQ